VEGAAAAYGSTIETTARWDGETLTARGDMLHVNVRRLPAMLDLPAITTDVSGSYDVTVAGAAWRADLALARSTVEDGVIGDGTRVTIDRMTPEIAYEIHGDVANIDLARLRPFVTLEPEQERWLDGRVTARIDATGRSTDPARAVADITAHVTNSTVAGMQIPGLDVRAVLNQRRLAAGLKGTVTGVTNEAVGAGSRVPFAADGWIDAHLTLPDITDPARLDTASGRANLRITNARVRDIAIDSLELEGALAGGLAEIRTFALSSPDASITASGTLAVDRSADLESDFTYKVAAADLSRFETLLGRPIAGGVTLEGRVTGPAMRPATQGELSLSELEVATVQALTITGRYDVVVPDRDVARATSQFNGTGTFVQVGDTAVDRIHANATYAGGRLDVETTISQQKRTVALTGALVPHPDHHEVHVRRLSVAAGGPEWQLASGREAIVQYGGDRVVVRHLDLVSGASSISIDGEIGGNGSEPLMLSVQAVRLEDVNQLLMGTHEVTGQLDGTVRVQGSMKAPRVTGEFTVVKGAVDGVAFERLAAKGSYAEEAVDVDASLEAGAAGRLAARGVMPIRFGADAPEAAPAFDLTIQSDALDMGLLQPAVGDHVEALRGRASVDVRIAGPARAPSIKGRAQIANAGFTISATGMTYPQLNALLAFDGNRMTVEQFLIQDDDQHTATMTGEISLSLSGPPSEFNLQIATDDFHLLDNPFGELIVTSDLRAMGTLVAPLVTGTISVDRALLEVDELLDRFAAGGYKPVEDPAAPAPRDPAAEQPAAEAERKVQKAAIGSEASYSITLDLPDTVVLRGRDVRARGGSFGLGDLNVTLGGALSLAKDANAPTTVRGTLSVVRGDYTFQSRRFTIARDSQLRFTGDQVLNPLLDVTAERQIGGVLARVGITGTAREPEIALSSEPPLDEGDILSLIAFNQTMNELGTTERVSLAARAGTLAARALATPLADSVARALDFDVFEIQPSENVASGGTLTVGRQVTEDLFVGFRQQFGTDDVSILSFEYRISEFLRLVTSFAQGAERSRTLPRAETAGIDLFYVIRR
jgi:autotransporter translocation and assembly factor TamB